MYSLEKPDAERKVCACGAAVPSPRQRSERQYTSLKIAAIRCHLSPIGGKLRAMSVRGQERMQFILLSTWFRMKEANTGRGSGVQPVQRHWDSSKSELEREPERKEGGAGEGRMREREHRERCRLI